jgi:uncharacterized protein (DUF4415 family)
MTTGIEELKLPKKRTGRGPGKRPALVNTSLRIPEDVLSYFDTHFPYSKQAKIREILIDFVKQHQGANP